VAGANGTADNVPAAGGSSLAGSGSAGTTLNGMPAAYGYWDAGAGSGFSSNAGLGGGGGAGRIVLHTASGGLTVSGIVSPDPSTPCVTTGTIP
jgi:hypothetical protein